MTTLSGLEKVEMERTLHNLERVRDAKKQELNRLKQQYQKLEADLRSAGTALHNLTGSILALREDLGLEGEGEQNILTFQEAHPEPKEPVIDSSRAIMLIVARYHDRGGIGFERIYSITQEEGLKVDREYLHTVLNRKRRRQKKLEKRDDKWFLTDKGREELGIARN
jgi:type II secretory pathway component PulJ